jgi:hypothetical protein
MAIVFMACANGAGAHDTKATGPPDGARTQVTLTVDGPAADFDLPPVSSMKGPPTALRISASRVENPSKQGVSILATLRSAGAEATERTVGTVTLYPSDRPGVFSLTLPPEIRADLGRAHPQRLRLSLQPAAPGRPLVAPLTVVVDPPEWR